jgi:uncharacterized protein YndB with AHSA1/START domain
MTTPNEPTTQSTPGNILLTRVFNAPRDLVFKAWTDPVHLARWWGPHGFTNPRCEWDLRPGGKIHVDMRGPDGTVYPMFGEYREIVEPERLVFTAGALDGDGRRLFEILNTVTFAESGDGTTVTLRTELQNVLPEAAHYLDGQLEGWSQSLERFAELLVELEREIVISRTFDAPAELVWEAMTNPERVVRWWGPRGFTMTIEVMDVRPGGAWKHVMHGPDGINYPNNCIFTEVVKPERISFSNSGGREGDPGLNFQSTWTFDAIDAGRTRVTIRMVFPSAADRNVVVKEYGAIEGGEQCLERMAEELSTAPLVIERTFNAPGEMVWKAITDAEQMRVWYFDLEGFCPEPGTAFEFTVEHNGRVIRHLCKVTEVIPGKKIAYTWRYADCEGESLVTMELFPDGNKTRLKLTHEGIHTFPKTASYARGNFQAGWTSLIGTELANFLDGQSKS